MAARIVVELGRQAFEVEVIETKFLLYHQDFTGDHAASNNPQLSGRWLPAFANGRHGTTLARVRSSARNHRKRETTSMKLSRLAPLALIISALLVASCANTVRGVGRDINQTADAVEDSVD
jgi:predicted small secreted protein